MKKVIGTRIRKLRGSKDLTQENIAVELDITAGAYAKIERGETDPSITRLKQIADILKVDVTFFFQDHSSALSIVAEPEARYGAYASKEDVENLAQLIKQITAKLEKLEAQVEGRNTNSN